ncbi:hypothetical protein EW146_g3270 [Bondarzewia mesenterica]|uniref:Uncharacterized protein n=1 Tax=Bondarzewia mesenterica TaxID=1095465 RepID=A0A4S4LZG9_9AGAM|nr:hypothetical protein EW146_g3270 [Bondarzewia mesenterica]
MPCHSRDVGFVFVTRLGPLSSFQTLLTSPRTQPESHTKKTVVSPEPIAKMGRPLTCCGAASSARLLLAFGVLPRVANLARRTLPLRNLLEAPIESPLPSFRAQAPISGFPHTALRRASKSYRPRAQRPNLEAESFISDEYQ